MSSKLIAAWHPSDSVFSFSLVILKLSDEKKNLNLIFCNRFFHHHVKAQRSAIYFLRFSLLFFSLGYFWPQILFPLNLTELWSWLWPLALKEDKLCLSGAMPQALCKLAGRDYFPGCEAMTFYGEWMSAVHVNSFSHDWEPWVCYLLYESESILSPRRMGHLVLYLRPHVMCSHVG